jgi:hypothetical protein
MTITSRRRLLLVVPLAFILVSGCQTKNPNAPAKVSGEVKFKDEALTGGTITFYSPEGTAYTATIGPDGTYQGADFPVGENLDVSVETESVKGAGEGSKAAAYGGGRMKMSPAPEGAKVTTAGKYVKIPAKYSKKESSGLKASLVSGKNTKNFELTD